jgi:predicted DsbA family dithiol-disulfide isomerase
VFSDILCPWCYLAKRRLDRAFEQFEHRDQVEVLWRTRQLQPEAPHKYEGTIHDLVSSHHGMSYEQAVSMHREFEALAALDGLDYHFDKVQVGNSFDAQRLVHLGAHHALASEMEERLLRAYFTEGVHIANREELVRLAVEVGLDAAKVRETLNSDAYADDVRADERRALELGLRGAPVCLFNEKLVVSGAQPVSVLLSAMREAWAGLCVTNTQASTNGCDGDTCALPETAEYDRVSA